MDAIAKVRDDVRCEPSPGAGVVGPAAGGGVLIAGKVTACWVEVGATRAPVTAAGAPGWIVQEHVILEQAEQGRNL
jgi:hypothetical protein